MKGHRPQRICKGLYANASQAVQRHPWSVDKIATPCSSALLWSFEKMTVLSGKTHLRGMGHGTRCAPLESFSEAELREIAGQGFSGPYMSVLCSLYWANPYAPWLADSLSNANASENSDLEF